MPIPLFSCDLFHLAGHPPGPSAARPAAAFHLSVLSHTPCCVYTPRLLHTHPSVGTEVISLSRLLGMMLTAVCS